LNELRDKGLGLAAISYDRPEILADFSQRHGITFPLLSDAGSATIKAFGLLNSFAEDAVGPGRDDPGVADNIHTFVAVAGVAPDAARIGMAFPGSFILDRQGRVTSRFFEDLYIERNTVSSILMKLGGQAGSITGLKRIDYFILSHFHADHAGGIAALSKLLPIGKCFDRGDFIEPANQQWRDAYLSVCGATRTILHPGDKIPLKGVRVDVVASNGELLAKPLAGSGSNPLSAAAENKPPDVPENQLMVGALFTYGKFTFLDLADLDWEKEMELACPVNRVGQVTVWQAGRHGALDGAGAPGFLYAIKPQVVVVNNGPRKGLGGPSPGRQKASTVHYERIAGTPGIEGIWQGHRSLLDPDHNTDENMIANLEETADCQGHWMRASVGRDGRFTMTNSRNGFRRTYAAR